MGRVSNDLSVWGKNGRGMKFLKISYSSCKSLGMAFRTRKTGLRTDYFSCIYNYLRTI